MPKPPPLLTAAEVAALLRVSKRTVHRRANAGKLPLYSHDTTGQHFERAKIEKIAGKS